ncbi:hypothetical protein JAAARDRAFT_187412 [Jaapia argillacea MUCL 33604]|uniref:Uncharacterized protein n=1 Tax=Jaapia argillacea MUCL 33604 TaxID=933084 RepID=A0A067QAQ7_9AGAM|nr:hypothetical protein JAAARDRAFT_187412 [Jaapia argillacea MUCL 33604]
MAEVRGRYEQWAKEEMQALLADWDKQKEVMVLSSGRSPEEYQRAIDNIREFQSILSALCDALSLCGYLFLTGPMPRQMGESPVPVALL